MPFALRNAIVASSLLCLFSTSILAGPLTPPAGAPAPTMKTLDEVEPRIAINATNTPGDATNSFIISQPGSYYLTGNITGEAAKNGIYITTSNVTLDLNGFMLQGIIGSLDGIKMTSFFRSITIRNGNVNGWGESGLETRIDNGVIEKLIVSSNASWGIDNRSAGTFSTTIIDCDVSFNEGGGISGGFFSYIANNRLLRNFGTAIRVGQGSTVIGNRCTVALESITPPLAAVGIELVSTDSHIEGNYVMNCATGILVTVGGNLIIKNTVSAATTAAYNIVTNNRCLVVTPPVSAAINGSSGGLSPSSSPWANFAF